MVIISRERKPSLLSQFRFCLPASRGTVKICNITTNIASGTLHLEGTVATALSGAQGTTMMKEDVPVQFPPGGSGGAVSH